MDWVRTFIYHISIYFTGNKELLKCNDVWGNFINHYGRRGCVVHYDEFPPPESVVHKKKRRHLDIQTVNNEPNENSDEVFTNDPEK